MKKHLIKLIGSLLLISIIPHLLPGQVLRPGNPNYTQAHPEKNYGMDNYLFLREAATQLQLLDFEQASFSLDNAVALNPQSAQVIIQRAKYLKLLGKKGEAAADLARANRLNPYAADLYGYNGPYGVLNVIAFQPEEAMQNLSPSSRMAYYVDLVEQLYQKTGTDQLELDYLEEAISQIENDQLAAAADLLEQVRNQFPNSALAYDLSGLIFTEQKRYSDAANAFAKAVVLQPDLAIAWVNFSRLERISGHYEIAEMYLNRAIQIQKDISKAYFERALLRKAQGDPEGAIEAYDLILENDEERYVEALFNRALTRKMAGDFDGALSDLNTVIEIFPDNAALYKNRANLYFLYGYYNRAIEDYTTAIDTKQDFAEAYYNRGLTHLKLYDMVSGCLDLNKSADLGYERAMEKQRFFCVE